MKLMNQGTEKVLGVGTHCLRHVIVGFLVMSSLYTFLLVHQIKPRQGTEKLGNPATGSTRIALRNILISVGSSASSFPRRAPYLQLWYNRNSTRALLFLDRPLPNGAGGDIDVVVSRNTSGFPYTFPRGHRSAIRIARMVKEAYERGEPHVEWYVFGDDDTLFFAENLADVVSKYDPGRWYYLGSRSESLAQNLRMSFDMAYGGGGFAISASLAGVLAGVLDSCLVRYPHLYGSDSRIFACLAELGVGLTLEAGFHQCDVRGSLLGLLSAHPLSPALSLHHLDAVEPLFPSMSRTESLAHLFKAVNADHSRIFQQTVCYSQPRNLSVSVSWGYVVQVYLGYQFITDLISPFRTFTPWRRGAHNSETQYAFNTREYPRNPCQRPDFFFMENVHVHHDKAHTIYVKKFSHDCEHKKAIARLRDVRVSSTRLEIDTPRLNTPRRQCCDIKEPFDMSLSVHLRPCGEEEMIFMDV